MKVNTVTGDLKNILNKLHIKYGLTYSDPHKDGSVSVKLGGVDLNQLQIENISKLMEEEGYVFVSSKAPSTDKRIRWSAGTRLRFIKGENFVPKIQVPKSKTKPIKLYTIAFTPPKGTKKAVTIEEHIITEEELNGYREEEYQDEDDLELAKMYINENYCMEFHQMFIECIVVTKKQLECIKEFYIR